MCIRDRSYIEQMILVNELVAKKLYMMPIYESPYIIDLRNRIDILYLLRDSLTRIEDLISVSYTHLDVYKRQFRFWKNT